jgi:hypothetical protein
METLRCPSCGHMWESEKYRIPEGGGPDSFTYGLADPLCGKCGVPGEPVDSDSASSAE